MKGKGIMFNDTISEAGYQKVDEAARTLAMTKSETGRESDAIDVALGLFNDVGVGKVYVDRQGSAVLEIDGDGDGPTLLIDGHIDSIPLHSATAWNHDPFGGDVDGGRLYGLGICDQKASIAAMAVAASEIFKRGVQTRGRLVLVASPAEEQMEGAVLTEIVERYSPTYAITTEPSDAKLIRSQRGRAKIQLTIEGRASHAGHATRGINAALFAADIISALGSSFPKKYDNDLEFDINCIDIVSDPYPSVSTIPGAALVRFDARFGSNQTKDSVLKAISSVAETVTTQRCGQAPRFNVSFVPAHIETWNGFITDIDEFAPAWDTPKHSTLVQEAKEALRKVSLPEDDGFYSFCTNGSYLAGEMKIPTIGFGAGEEHIAHQVDEYITFDSLHRTTLGLAAIITQLLS